MSNVRKRERSTHRLTVLDRALDLYEHTTNLLANEKYNKPNMRVLTIKIDNAATIIYHNCRSANEDLDAGKPDEARMRLELQVEALRQCKWLKTYIMMAKRKLHLRWNSVYYWKSLADNAKDIIEAWHKSEIKSFRKNHGL